MSSNSSSEAICYLGNGGVASNSVQCDPSGAINTCCPEGNVCLSNGMCFGTQTTGNYFMYTQDACVDETGEGCVPNCRSQQYNDGAGDSICGNQFTGFCCFEDHASGACNCDTGENAFTLPYGTPISTIGVLPQSDATQLAVSMTTISSLLNRGITEGTLPASSSTSVATFASQSSSRIVATSASQSRSSATSSSNCVQCPTEAPTCPLCAADETCSLQAASCHSCASTTCIVIGSTSSPSQQGTKHLSTGDEVGIAVGVVLLIAILSILGLVMIRARRRANLGGPEEQNAYLKAELATEGSEIRTWRNPPAELPSSLDRWSQKPATELPTRHNY